MAKHSEKHAKKKTKKKAVKGATTKDSKLDAQACSALAQGMQQSASGRLDYDQATTFATAANAADNEGKGNSSAAQLARDAKAFVNLYTSNSAGPNNINLYPTATVVHACSDVGVTVPLISNTASTSSLTAELIQTLVGNFNNVYPAGDFSVLLDPNNPISNAGGGSEDWAEWWINDPNTGVAYGFADIFPGSSAWLIEAGPGTEGVGCGVVPTAVLLSFGDDCSTNENAPPIAKTTTTAPVQTVSPELAYQEGYRVGQALNPSLTTQGYAETVCNVRHYPNDPAAQSNFYDGCMAGAGF